MQWLKKIWQRIRKWWKKRRKHKPSKIENLFLEIIMPKTVRGTWALPTTRTGGAALPVEELDYALVEMSADSGANFVEINRIPATDPQEVVVPDLEPGEWQFRVRPMDRLGQLGAPVLEAVMIVDDSPPGPVTDMQFTIE